MIARHHLATGPLGIRGLVVLAGCALLACGSQTATPVAKPAPQAPASRPAPPSTVTKPAVRPIVASPAPQGIAILVNEPPASRPIEPAKLFYVLYQDAVPGSKDGTIDIARTISEIKRQRTLPEYGMLDFEDPFCAVLKRGPSHPLHATVVRSMIDTIRAVRTNFPATKWTYWGFPEIPFWLDGIKGTDWATSPEELRSAARRDAVLSHRELFLECDWISPWAYDLFQRRSAPSSAVAQAEANGAKAWFAAKVAITREVFIEANRPIPPIIPCVSLLYAPGGRAAPDQVIPMEEFRSDLIDPLLALPIDGIALWTPLAYFTRLASMNTSDVKDGSVVKARAWVQRNLREGREPPRWSAEQRTNDGLATDLIQRYVRGMAESAGRRTP